MESDYHMAAGVHEILSIVRRNVYFDSYVRITDDFYRVLQAHLQEVLMDNLQTFPENKLSKLFDNAFEELLDDRFVRGDQTSRESLERAISDFADCEAFEGLDMTSQDSY